MGPIIEAIMWVVISLTLVGGFLTGFKMWMVHQEVLEKHRQDTLRQKETTKQLQWASHHDLVTDKRNELRAGEQ